MTPMPTVSIGVAAALLGLASAAGAYAQPRGRDVAIVIPRGQECFRHEGSGVRFTGAFRAGQRVWASSTGDATFADGRGEWMMTQERSVYVTWGRRNDNSFGFSGEPWIVPASGRYTFTYSPNAMVGGRGVFIVCAR